MSNLVCCVLTNVFLFPRQRAANNMLRSHFPRSATRAGGDYGTLSREKPDTCSRGGYVLLQSLIAEKHPPKEIGPLANWPLSFLH